MPVLTTTSDVPTNIQGFYDRTKLHRAIPLQVHDRVGEPHPIPKNEGDRIEMHRYGALPPAPRLKEGEPPSGRKAQVSKLYTNLVQFGDFLTFTDKLKMTSPDATLARFAELLGEQEGQTLDLFHRDQLNAGTGVRYAGGESSRSDINDAPSASDFKAILRILEGNNAKPVREMITASTKVSTSPIRPSFIAYCHTDARQDLEDIDGFVPVERYASQKGVMEGEIGSYKGIRFIGTTNAKIHKGEGSGTKNGMVSEGGSNVDVYTMVIVARYAYGTVPLQKAGAQNIVKDLGKVGFNPLNQFGTSGWKAFTGGLIKNDNFIIRYEHGVSDL